MLSEHFSKNKLKVIGKPFKASKHHHYLVEFECPFCGKTFIRRTDTKAKSCGCVYNHLRSVAIQKHNGLSNSAIFRAWQNMLARCEKPYATGYVNYGARGIKVCAEWHTFENFYNDMYPSYQEGLTLDRIDVNGNYCFANCRWADTETQNYNKTNTAYIEYEGQKYTSKQIKEKFGLKYCTVLSRIKRSGWSVKEALSTPLQQGWKVGIKEVRANGT